MAESGPFHHEVLRLALPAIGENMVRFSVGIADTYLLGHLGSAPLAVLGLSNQLYVFGAVIAAPLIVGCSVLTAQAVGAANRARAHQVFAQGIWLAIPISVALSIVGFAFAPQALWLIGAEESVVRLGTPFLRLLMVSIPLEILIFVITGCLRGAGDTRTPMYIMIVWASIHIPTAYLFTNSPISPLYLGANGVAAAGIVGRCAGLALLLIWLSRGRLPLDLREVSWQFERESSKAILRLGTPSGLEQLALRLGQTANIRVIATLGTLNYAAYLIGFNSLSIALMVGIGFTVAATTVVAQQVGAGQPVGAHRGARQTWLIAVVTMGLIGVGYFLWTPAIIGFFTGDQQIIALSTFPLQLVSFILPFEATNQILSGAFRGAGNTRWPMLITAGGNLLVRFPLTLLLINSFGLLGAWYALMAEITLRALVHMWRFRRNSWLRMIQPTLKAGRPDPKGL